LKNIIKGYFKRYPFWEFNGLLLPKNLSVSGNKIKAMF